MAEKEEEKRAQITMGKYIRNNIIQKGIKKYSIVIIVSIAILVILAGAIYYLKIYDGVENESDPKNASIAAKNIMTDVTIDQNGNINLNKSIKDWWDELKKQDNKITHYLDSAEDLARLLNASLVTQYLDTRENPDEPIDWEKIIEKMGKGEVYTINKSDSTSSGTTSNTSSTASNNTSTSSNNTSSTTSNNTTSNTSTAPTTTVNTNANTNTSTTRGNTQAAELHALGDRADNGDDAARQELITKLVQIINSVNGPYGMRPSVIIGQIFQETSYVRTPKVTKTGRNTGKTLAGTANNIISVNYEMWGSNDYVRSKDGQSVSIPLPRWAQNKQYDEFYVSQGATEETRTYSYEKMRVYDSVEDCLEDYIALMVAYRPGLSNNDQSAYDALLKGYATDQSYKDKVNWFINKYNLTQYDNGVTPTGSTAQLSSTPGAGDPIQGIVKLKRRNENDEEYTMSYVSPSKFQELISKYQQSGEEEDKQEALKHFTLEVTGTSSYGGSANFTKYNLTEEQLRGLARVCIREQDHNPKGIAAEASMMANGFEIRAKGTAHGKTGAEGLYEYVRNGSENDVFFDTSQYGGSYNTPYLMDTGHAHDGRTCEPTPEEIEIVRKVFVMGMRTLPAYVDEHDDIGDISSVTNNGSEISPSDKASYQQNVSVIHNIMGSTYTFFCFPQDNYVGDPFGYRSEDLRRKLGDAHYEYNESGNWQLIGGTVSGTASGGQRAGNFKNASEITPQQLVQSATNVMNKARESLSTQNITVYGNSVSEIPCDLQPYRGSQSIDIIGDSHLAHNLIDQKGIKVGDQITYISCDRLVARALYDLGFTDQNAIGPKWFEQHGFIRQEGIENIGYGSIVWCYSASNPSKWKHTFISCGPINPGQPFYRLDAGSNSRIAKQQPFNDEGWGYSTSHVVVFNIPGYGRGTTGDISNLGGTSGTLNSQKGTEIVNYADQFVGNPYVYGGNSLTNGIDCSHFVWQVLTHCGVYDGDYLTSGEWVNVGTPVGDGKSIEEDIKQAVAGDIISWDGHVGIYDGNGLMVEAKGAAWGITHDRDPTNCHSHPYLGIRRFTNDVTNVNPSGGYGNSKVVAKVAKWNEHTTIVESNDPEVESYERTTYTMKTELIDYQKVMSKYQMPFNYLWALLLISENKDFTFDIAKLVYNSEFVITVHDDVTKTNSTNTTEYSRTTTEYYDVAVPKPGGDVSIRTESREVTHNYYKTTTNKDIDDKLTIALTRAKSWVSDYDIEYEYKKGKKEVNKGKKIKLDDAEEPETDTESDGNDKIKNKTTQTTTEIVTISYTSEPTKAVERGEPNFSSILRDNYDARTNILSAREWLIEILEKNADTRNMVDLTNYLIYKATGTNTGIKDYDFSEFDPESFEQFLDELVGNTDAEKIWFALKNEGYSEYAIAGAMGNLDYESGLRPNNLQNVYEKQLGSDNQYTANINGGTYSQEQFANDRAGYGIAQWTSKFRKEGLYKYVSNYYKVDDKSEEDSKETLIRIDDLKAQVEFLIAELKGTGPAADYATRIKEGSVGQEGIISTVEDWEKAESVRDATIYFLRFYEGPDNLSSLEERVNRAEKYYNQLRGMLPPGNTLNGNGTGADGRATKEGWTNSGNVSIPIYKQGGDAPWASKDYLGRESRYRGCGPCALAMAVSGLTNSDVTPDIIIDKLNQKGYLMSASDTGAPASEYIASEYGLTYRRISNGWAPLSQSEREDMNQALQSGHVIVTSTGCTANGHYIIVYGYKDGGYYVTDPGSSYTADTLYSYDDVFFDIHQGLFVLGKN